MVELCKEAIISRLAITASPIPEYVAVQVLVLSFLFLENKKFPLTTIPNAKIMKAALLLINRVI